MRLSYKMFVKDKGQPISESWAEEVTEIVPEGTTAKDHAKGIVERFNSYLKLGEKQRVLVDVEEIELKESDEPRLKHDWGKVSLVTEKGGYDKMKCKNCGATGKRYGFTNIVLDRAFKKNVFCPFKQSKLSL